MIPNLPSLRTWTPPRHPRPPCFPEPGLPGSPGLVMLEITRDSQPPRPGHIQHYSGTWPRSSSRLLQETPPSLPSAPVVQTRLTLLILLILLILVMQLILLIQRILLILSELLLLQIQFMRGSMMTSCVSGPTQPLTLPVSMPRSREWPRRDARSVNNFL
mgnify:CR=1 FL=1